jgi:zinc protease
MGRGPQTFMLGAVPATGVTADAAAAALKAEVARVARDGVSEAELQRVKTQWTASEVYKLDSVFSQAQELGSYWINGMDIQTGTRLLKLLRGVTSAQVQSVAQRLFSEDQLTTAVLVPDASRRAPPRSGPRPALPRH